MIKNVEKKLYVLVITFTLTTIFFSVLFLFSDDKPDTYKEISFRIYTQNSFVDVSTYQNEDHVLYVFLPAYAELAHTSFLLSPNQSILLGDSAISNGTSCKDFILNEKYNLSINGHPSILCFLRSENVSSLFIDTATKSMEQIHRDKTAKEQAALTLYDENGTLNFSDSHCSLSGRGNSTWLQEKKPYALTLSSEASLLGMSSSTGWVLLSNSLDKTNLHNKIVYDFAKKIDFDWSPDTRFVDLYLNGKYNGLYLLAEGIEVTDNRLNITPTDGDFLCTLDFDIRWSSLQNPFITQGGRTVAVVEPQLLSYQEMYQIQTRVNELEEALLDRGNTTLDFTINVQSWIYKYLIDEIFANLDADLSSSYFYYKDELFYAGPIWDYDSTFASSLSTKNPQAFYAKLLRKYGNFKSHYYNALYNNATFYQQMTHVYASEFLPLLQELILYDISQLSLSINSAAKMNNIRWNIESQNQWDSAFVSDTLVDYLCKRIAFLNDAWINNIEYCTIQLKAPETRGDYQSITVKKGDYISSSDLILNYPIWIIEDTGEQFDFNQPIMEDFALIPYGLNEEGIATRDIVTNFSIAFIFLLFIFLIYVDYKHSFGKE